MNVGKEQINSLNKYIKKLEGEVTIASNINSVLI